MFVRIEKCIFRLRTTAGFTMTNKHYAALTALLILLLSVPHASALDELFKTPVINDTGQHRAFKMALADFNSDTIPDLVVAHEFDITFLAGNGNGTFQPPQVIYANTFQKIGAIATGDANNDGRVDLIVGGKSTGFDIVLGNGDGTFQAPQFHAVRGGLVWGIAINDVNNDGIADVVASYACSPQSCSNKHRVGIFLGTGGGNFGTERAYLLALSEVSSGSPSALKVIDINNDGASDLLILEQGIGTPVLTVMLGRGDGTFRTLHTFPINLGIQALATGDVNGDGKLDVVIGILCTGGCFPAHEGAVAVLLGNGSGGFAPATLYSSGAYSVTGVDVADVTADGKPDIVLSDLCIQAGASCSTGKVGILAGNGDGTFNPVQLYNSAGFFASDIAVADVNRDNKPDVIVLNTSQNVFLETNGSASVLLGKAKFATQINVASSANPSNVGQAVTFTATVSSASSLKPTGTVTFFRDGVSIGRLPLVEGVTQLTTTHLPLGSPTITATYNGSDLFIKSTSPPLTQTVQPAGSTR